MDYDRKSHSKQLMLVHLIFVCKYRKKLLVKFGEDIKSIFYNISNEYNFTIEEMEVDKDHIHLLVKYNTKTSVLQIVRWLKQISTYRVWRLNYNTILQNHFWNEHTFWSNGYFACSIGNVSAETIRKYIEEQG